jgi:hypothetical protein
MLRAGSSGTDGVLLSQSQIGKLPSLLGLPKNRADQAVPLFFYFPICEK